MEETLRLCIKSALLQDSSIGYFDYEKKKSTGGSFVTYIVMVEFSDGSTIEVRRRYSDFEKLHESLTRKYCFLLIPPIPSKNASDVEVKTMAGSAASSSDQLVQYRKWWFQRFLDQLMSCPQLVDDEMVYLFLTNPDPSYWKSATEFIPNKVVGMKAPIAIPKRVSTEIGNLYNSIIPSVIEQCKEFEQKQRRILVSLRKISEIYGQLGQEFNAFSLEHASSSQLLDGIGQMFDTFADSNGQLLAQEIVCLEAQHLMAVAMAFHKLLANYINANIDYESLAERLCLARSSLLTKESDRVVDSTISIATSVSSTASELELHAEQVRLDLAETSESILMQLDEWMGNLVRSKWNSMFANLKTSTCQDDLSCISTIKNL